MSPETFSSLLNVVFDALPLHKGLSVQDVASLVRFSTVVVRDAPEGTSKISQTHITRCLNLFADDERFVVSPSLRADVLEFLVKICSDRVSPSSSSDTLTLTRTTACVPENSRPKQSMVNSEGSPGRIH